MHLVRFKVSGKCFWLLLSKGIHKQTHFNSLLRSSCWIANVQKKTHPGYRSDLCAKLLFNPGRQKCDLLAKNDRFVKVNHKKAIYLACARRTDRHRWSSWSQLQGDRTCDRKRENIWSKRNLGNSGQLNLNQTSDVMNILNLPLRPILWR